MRPFLACAFVATLLSGALSAPSEASKWENFKSLHGKKHASHEDSARMRAFLQRDADIEAHNARYAAGLESFSRQHNQYSDLTPEEFRKAALGFIPAVNSSDIPVSTVPAMPSAPTAFDWTSQNIMTPVRNQLYCGSCYAFASAGVLEALLKWKSGINIDLSEQDVVDCSYLKFMNGRMNNGCGGGFPDFVFDYYNVKDAVQEAYYPYTSGQSQRVGYCRQAPTHPIFRGRLRYQHVMPTREDDIENILLQKGPLVLGMAADNQYKDYFNDLGDGIFDMDIAINATPNHVVVLTGYGYENGKRFWRIKNSWGTTWGRGGYGKIVRGKNMCNIMSAGVWFVEGL